jgi:hypothetical protein
MTRLYTDFQACQDIFANRAKLRRMPRNLPATDKPAVKPKEIKLQVRIGEELYEAAMEKAERLGGVSAVVRALLRQWVEGGPMPSDADILAERVPAPYKRRRSK